MAASVWDTPYISSDLLKENMTCITFGQPLVSVDVIQRVTRARPEMVTTVHAIFIEQDQIPSLMSLLDVSWNQKSQKTESKGTLGAHVSMAINNAQTMVIYSVVVSNY